MMEKPSNIVQIIEKQRLGFNVPKQIDIAYSKLKCLAGDLKFFYDLSQRVYCPVFASKFCHKKGHENLLISANEEGKVFLMDTNAPRGKKILSCFQAHDNAVFDLAWVDQDVSFISASGDQSAHLWQLTESTLRSVSQFLGHTHSVKTISCRPDDANIFATGGRDGSLIVWDKRMQNPAQEIPHRVEPYKIINHSHEDYSFFKNRRCGSQKNSVTGLVFQDGENLISCSAGDGSVFQLTLSREKRANFANMDEDVLIKVWDMRKTYCVKKRLPHAKHTMIYSGTGKNGFSYLAVSPCRLRLYANCIDDYVYCYNIGTYDERPIAEYGGPNGSSFYIKNCVSPDGRYIATGSSDGKAYIWSVANHFVPIVSLSGHAAEVTCIDWCKAGEPKLVTCSDDATVRIWRLHPEEMACNDPALRGWAERHPVKSLRFIQRMEYTLKKRKYYHSDSMKTPPKSTKVQNENISPEIRQAEKKQCRESSLDMSSLTADLPNFVIDGTSPHNHRCSRPPKPKDSNWLSKLKEKTSNVSIKPKQLTVRRKSVSNGSSPARGSLLRFFKVSSRPSSEQQNISSTDPNSKLSSLES